jgi:hypothetical protein
MFSIPGSEFVISRHWLYVNMRSRFYLFTHGLEQPYLQTKLVSLEKPIRI